MFASVAIRLACMTKTKMLIATTVFLVALLVGCGKDAGSPTTPVPPGDAQCSTLYAAGVTVAATADLSKPCTDSSGTKQNPTASSQKCVDGKRVLVWNRYGWAWVGSTFTVSTNTPPSSEYAGC